MLRSEEREASLLADSHIHLDHLNESALDALRSRAEAGEYRALVPGIRPAQWREALSRFSEASGWVDLAFGLHPWELEAASVGDWRGELREALTSPMVVALGEIGLDHHRWKRPEDRALAAEIFKEQLMLARQLALPVVIHCVRAHAETLALVKSHGRGLRGVVHAFSGSREERQAWERAGFVVGLGSLATQAGAKRARQAAIEAPTFLLETDAPFMRTASEHAAALNAGVDTSAAVGTGQILEVAQAVAELRGAPVDEVIASAWSTWKTIFGARSR